MRISLLFAREVHSYLIGSHFEWYGRPADSSGRPFYVIPGEVPLGSNCCCPAMGRPAHYTVVEPKLLTINLELHPGSVARGFRNRPIDYE